MNKEFILLRVRQKIDKLRADYDATWEVQRSKSVEFKRCKIKQKIQLLILVEQLALQSNDNLTITDEDAVASLKQLVRL